MGLVHLKKRIDKCFHCDSDVNWGIEPAKLNVGDWFENPESLAEEIAIGKNEDGTTKFEVICRCNSCGVKNKYYVDHN